MKTWRVWAPRPRKVELQIGRDRHALAPVEGGWWEAALPEKAGEPRYGFVLDGAGPFPDPRAPRLPEGVHGPAEVVDHRSFSWSDQHWSPPPLSTTSLIYELHTGTFSPEGTFDGVAGRLDHLVSLGVTHVELLPVNSFAGRRGWGYDGVGLYAPHEPYGGPEGLKRLVNACHEKGLAVLLDVVYNHIGPEGNYLGHYGPYLHRGKGTPWGGAVNLDGPESDEVRRFILDNVVMWLRDYHMDGLRIDAIDAFQDQSAKHLLAEMREVAGAVEEETGLRKVLIAESDLNDPRVVRPIAAGGYGMDAQWSDDFHHCLHVQLTGEKRGYYADFQGMEKLAKALRQAFVYDGVYSHQRKRRHGAPPVGLDGRSFLGYLQNHDQVGNRAGGERLTHLIAPRKLRIAAALLLTSPFIPMLFQGEEWGATSPFLYFTDHGDQALARAVRRGRLRDFRSFGWKRSEFPDPQDEETFLRSRPNWDECGAPGHQSLLQWYRELIRLRRRRHDLRDPNLDGVDTAHDDLQHWIAIRRGLHQVIANFSGASCQVPLFPRCGRSVLLSSGVEGGRADGDFLPMGPESVAILGPGEDREGV